ncbi:hypothetical protein CBL_02488 [Carabus blaptoides fortunei]
MKPHIEYFHECECENHKHQNNVGTVATPPASNINSHQFSFAFAETEAGLTILISARECVVSTLWVSALEAYFKKLIYSVSESEDSSATGDTEVAAKFFLLNLIERVRWEHSVR